MATDPPKEGSTPSDPGGQIPPVVLGYLRDAFPELSPEELAIRLRQLTEKGLVVRHAQDVRPIAPPARSEDVDEDLVPENFGKPVIERAGWLNLKLTKERSAGYLAYALMGLFCMVVVATTIAIFQLDSTETATKLMDLSDKLLVIVVGVLAYYFGSKKSDE